MILVTTAHGTYPIHQHWFNPVDQCVRRWERSGKPQSPFTSLFLIDGMGRMIWAA